MRVTGGAGVLNVSFDASGALAAQQAQVEALQARSYEVVHTSAGFDVFDADTGAQLVSGAPATFTLDGLEFDVSGASVVGDSFKVSPMADAIDNYSVVITNPEDFANSVDPAGSLSDNRNSLAIYDLKDLKIVGGVDTFQSGYSTLIAGVGSKVASSEASFLTFEVLNKNSEMNRESLSGVNIEEEAANVLKLQQAYTANAKVVQAAQSVFDELMNILR